MIIALDDSGNRVVARKASKKEQYFCPLCNERLTLRQGKIRLAHFAHKIDSDCLASRINKTEWHYLWQQEFGEENAEIVVKAAGVTHIADTLLGDTVVEFQHSKIDECEVTERNLFYNFLGCSVIWIFDIRKEYENGQIRQYMRKSQYEWMFEWTSRAKKAIIRALYRADAVYLQVSDKYLLEIVWYPEIENEDGSFIKIDKFRGRLYNKNTIIKKIINSSNKDFKIDAHLDDDKNWALSEWIEQARAGGNLVKIPYRCKYYNIK